MAPVRGGGGEDHRRRQGLIVSRVLRRLFQLATGRRPAAADVDAELDLHRDLHVAELVERGVPREEAVRRADAALGNRAALVRRIGAIDRAHHRSRSRSESVAKWGVDCRLAVRGLRRDPWFALAAAGLVTLGVGANVAVFSILNAAFFQRLPYPAPDRIVAIMESRRGGTMPVAGQNVRDWQARATGFVHLAAYRAGGAVLHASGEPATVSIAQVSREFAGVMGVAPMRGRWFSADEARVGGAPAVVLSERLWRRQFGADPEVMGATVRIDRMPATVIGVMPARLGFPVGADLWTPAEPWDDNPSRTAHNWRVIGRLADGVSVADAARSLSDLTRQLVATEPPSEHLADGAAVTPLRATLLGQSPRVLRLLQGAVGLLLLIALLNLTTLLLARAAKRQPEIAMITTLGAGRGDLIRRFLIESAVVTIVGAGAGVALWAAARPALLDALSRLVPFVTGLPIDGVFLAVVIGSVAVVALVAGLVPALWVSRAVDRGAVRRNARGTTGPSRMMHWLVGVEVAATFVLLAGAGLLGRSLARMLDQPLGYDLEGRVAFPVPLADADGLPYADPVRRQVFFDRLLDRVGAVPGVRTAALTTAVPLDGWVPNGSARIRGEPSDAGGPAATSDYRIVSAGFFDALGIPLRRGRVFEPADGPAAPAVAVVSESFGRVHLGGGNPIGRLIQFPGMGDGDGGWAEIVGVVGDLRQTGPGDEPAAAVYYDYRQRSHRRTVSVVARVTGSETAALDALRAILRDMEPSAPFEGAALGSTLAEVVAGPRLRAVVLTVFATVALALAGVGLFGVVGFVVLRRTRELGVRIALGASRRRVALAAVGGTLVPVLGGVAVGALVALAIGRLVRGFLFGISAVDPVSLGVAAGAVLVVAALAWVLPIRRAISIEPSNSLRLE